MKTFQSNLIPGEMREHVQDVIDDHQLTLMKPQPLIQSYIV